MNKLENKNLLYTVIDEISKNLKENPNVNPENFSLKLTEILTEKEITKIRKDFQEESLKIKEKLESKNASVNHIPDTVISGIMLGGKENVDKYLSGEFTHVADYAYETINLSQFMPKNNPEIISLISNNKELQEQLKTIKLNEEKLITANKKNDFVQDRKETLAGNLSKKETKRSFQI